MKDNNPFQPALSQPADDSVLSNDPAADNFTAEAATATDAFKPSKPAVMLDGISPNPNLAAEAVVTPATLDNDLTAALSGQPDNPTTSAPGESLTQPTDVSSSFDAATPPVGVDTFSDTANFGLNPTPDSAVESSAENPLLNDNSTEPTTDAAPPTDSVGTTSTDPNDPMNQIAALTDDKSAAPSGTKPPKQFTISILSIILFVLALTGIGGTIFFYIQNNKHADDLAEANAKVQQLTDQSDQSSTADNKTTSQFDALQDKIAELTKQNDDKQKTIDDNKTTIDEQTKKITDLTTQNEDLTKKVQDISNLTTKTDSLLNRLDKIYPADSSTGSTTNP